MKKRIFSVLIIFCGVIGYASEISIDFYGLSYHIKKEESYYNAPRSVGSSNGQWVFNPGIGLNYDFRKKGAMGFSGYGQLGYFKDCADYPFYFVGLGIKYRNYLYGSSNVFWSVKVAATVAEAEDWTTIGGYNSTQIDISYGRNVAFLPIGGIGFGYQFDNKNYLEYSLTYVPQNDAIGGTAGTNLLFMWITFGF